MCHELTDTLMTKKQFASFSPLDTGACEVASSLHVRCDNRLVHLIRPTMEGHAFDEASSC